MFRALRIIFCLLACVCVTAGFFIGAYFGFAYALISFATAVVFAILMFLVKDGNPFHRQKEAEKIDFMNTNEENEQIRRKTEISEAGEEQKLPKE